MAADPVEELTDEALETMLLLCGVHIGYLDGGAYGSGYYATDNGDLSTFFFSSRLRRELGCGAAADKRRLMLNCKAALLAGHGHFTPEDQ